jgi:hypothetical protein
LLLLPTLLEWCWPEQRKAIFLEFLSLSLVCVCCSSRSSHVTAHTYSSHRGRWPRFLSCLILTDLFMFKISTVFENLNLFFVTKNVAVFFTSFLMMHVHAGTMGLHTQHNCILCLVPCHVHP